MSRFMKKKNTMKITYYGRRDVGLQITLRVTSSISIFVYKDNKSSEKIYSVNITWNRTNSNAASCSIPSSSLFPALL